MGWISNPELWVAFFTLCALEIVLGIDNVIFITILAGSLPENQQARARTLGLGMAMFTRILLLLSISWMAKLTTPLFSIPFLPAGEVADISGRDLILIVGGLFLLFKSTHEIHEKLEDDGDKVSAAKRSFGMIIVQIMLLDIVFSLDSVITAVGMVNNIPVMVGAVVTSVIFMMFCSGAISRFVDARPTLKMLALSFLLLIGFTLIAEGFGQHIPKGYIYFAMGFSFFVELLNTRTRKKKQSAEPA